MAYKFNPKTNNVLFFTTNIAEARAIIAKTNKQLRQMGIPSRYKMRGRGPMSVRTISQWNSDAGCPLSNAVVGAVYLQKQDGVYFDGTKRWKTVQQDKSHAAIFAMLVR